MVSARMHFLGGRARIFKGGDISICSNCRLVAISQKHAFYQAFYAAV